MDRIIGYYIWMVFEDYWILYWRFLDRIIGWDYWIGLLDGFFLPKLWRGPRPAGAFLAGAFFFLFCFILSKMVINGQQMWFLNQIFGKFDHDRVPFIWSIHLYDRSIYMIDPFIWSNMTKYNHFSKNLVHKSVLLTNYDNFWEYDVKTKKTPLRGMPLRAAGHVRVWVKKNHPIIQSNNPIQ